MTAWPPYSNSPVTSRLLATPRGDAVGREHRAAHAGDAPSVRTSWSTRWRGPVEDPAGRDVLAHPLLERRDEHRCRCPTGCGSAAPSSRARRSCRHRARPTRRPGRRRRRARAATPASHRRPTRRRRGPTAGPSGRGQGCRRGWSDGPSRRCPASPATRGRRSRRCPSAAARGCRRGTARRSSTTPGRRGWPRSPGRAARPSGRRRRARTWRRGRRARLPRRRRRHPWADPMPRRPARDHCSTDVDRCATSGTTRSATASSSSRGASCRARRRGRGIRPRARRAARPRSPRRRGTRAGSTPSRRAPSSHGSGHGFPRVTSDAVTTTGGCGSPVAAMRASARSRVPEVTMAVGTPPAARAPSRSAAPGSTTMPSTSATSICEDPVEGRVAVALGQQLGDDAGGGHPWKPRSRSGSTPNSPHHRIHERSTAAIESMSVPSMSRRTPAKGASKGAADRTEVGGTAVSLGCRPRVAPMPEPTEPPPGPHRSRPRRSRVSRRDGRAPRSSARRSPSSRSSAAGRGRRRCSREGSTRSPRRSAPSPPRPRRTAGS